MEDEGLTVGRLRLLICDLPDDTPVYPVWSDIPGDTEPGVSIDGAFVGEHDVYDRLALQIRVSLFYLEDSDDWEDKECEA